MTKYTTVSVDLLRPISGSDFESAVASHKADFRVRTLPCYDLLKTNEKEIPKANEEGKIPGQ